MDVVQRTLLVSCMAVPFDLISSGLEIRRRKKGSGASGFGILPHLCGAGAVLIAPFLRHGAPNPDAIPYWCRFLGVLLMIVWHYLLVWILPRWIARSAETSHRVDETSTST